jgi:hypothetical protein
VERRQAHRQAHRQGLLDFDMNVRGESIIATYCTDPFA